MSALRLLAACAVAGLLAGCEAAATLAPLEEPPAEAAPVVPVTQEPVVPEVKARVPATPAQAERYLRRLAPYLVSRELSSAELDRVASEGEPAVEPILRSWVEAEGFAQSARMLVQQKLSVSGSRGGIDYELPGNLVLQMVREKLPLKQLLTADTCYSPKGEKIACDSGAPFTAGVLTTRAYLSSRASRFNLTRSSTLMHVFACRSYPMEDTLQPRLERTRLIPMFQAQTPEEQTDERAQSGFGNGFACYTCHGQFSAHAQLFVKFDESGMWRQTASGQQDPSGELGRSVNGLFTSHLKDPEAAKEERSQVLGRDVANLGEAARVLAESPTFLQCQVRNLLEYALGLDAATKIDPALLDAVRETAQAEAADPSFRQLTVATFSNPRVIDSVLQSFGATP